MGNRGVRYEGPDAGVTTLRLDRPDSANALSDTLLDDLLEAFARARDDPGTRCVVLASTHPRTFSAGGDLAGFAAEVPSAAKHAALARFPELFRLLGTLGKPVLCAVNGHCLAGALGLALACDLVVAAEEATFGTPEIDVGVFPFMVAALISRHVSPKAMSELLLLGDRIDAATAWRLGLVNRVVPRAELDGAVAEWSARLAAKSPVLLRMGKDALWHQQDLGLEAAWEYLRAQLALALSTEDAREGVAAFFEQREPQWTGR